MLFFQIYDLIIGLIFLVLGVLLFIKSQRFDDKLKKKYHFSQKEYTRKISVALIGLGIIILINSI